MTLTGILAVVLSMMLSGPMRAYVDTGRRAALVDLGETALARMTREIRLALPNSIRVRNGAQCRVDRVPAHTGQAHATAWRRRRVPCLAAAPRALATRSSSLVRMPSSMWSGNCSVLRTSKPEGTASTRPTPRTAWWFSTPGSPVPMTLTRATISPRLAPWVNDIGFDGSDQSHRG